MAKIIEAKAIISADDKTGPGIKSAIDRLNAITKAQKSFAASGAKDFMAVNSHLDGLNKRLSAIDGFRAQHSALVAARQQFKAAEADVQRLGRAMKETAAPTRSMTLEYERSQRAVKQAAAAYADKVAAVKAAKAEMASYGVTLTNINKKQAEAAHVLARPAPPRARPSPGFQPPTPGKHSATDKGSTPKPASDKGSGVPIAEGAGLFGIGKVVSDVVTAGSKVDSERSQMRQAGWTEAEIKTAEHRANRLAAEWGVSPSSAMNIIREGRPTFGGDLQQTLKSVPDFFATRTAMKQKNPGAGEGQIDGQLGMLIKAGEIMGYSQDPAKLKSYTDFMTKMVQVHGSALRGEEVLNFAKSSKTAGQNASFEMLSSMFPTMLPELGGDRLGTSLMTLRQALVGGKMKHSAAKNLEGLGLIEDGGKIIVPKTGEIKGIKPGGIKGSKLIESDLPGWVQQYLVPAMDKKGIAPEDRNTKLSGLFSDRNAEYVISLILNNLDRMKKDEAVTKKAKGIEGAKEALKDDPLLAASRVKGGGENAFAALADPVMEPLKAAAGGAADALNSLADSARQNPNATAGGIAGGGLIGGAGAFLSMAGRSLVPRLAMAGVGLGMGATAGGLALPYLLQQAYPDLKKKAEADTAYAFNRSGRGVPMGDGRYFSGYDGYGDKLLELQKNRLGGGQPAIGFDASKFSDIKAKVEQPVPVDVTGKVALDPASRVDVNVNVKVQGPATVTGQSVSAGGNAKGSVGTSTAGSYD